MSDGQADAMVSDGDRIFVQSKLAIATECFAANQASCEHDGSIPDAGLSTQDVAPGVSCHSTGEQLLSAKKENSGRPSPESQATTSSSGL